MLAWFTSLQGAIVLSAIAMLSFIGYAILESRYFLEQWTPGVTAATLETLFVLLLVGLWLWALFAAADEKDWGLIVALVIAVVTALIAAYDLIRYSPIPYAWPLVQIAVWVMLVSSVLTVASILAYLLK